VQLLASYPQSLQNPDLCERIFCITAFRFYQAAKRRGTLRLSPQTRNTEWANNVHEGPLVLDHTSCAQPLVTRFLIFLTVCMVVFCGLFLVNFILFVHEWSFDLCERGGLESMCRWMGARKLGVIERMVRRVARTCWIESQGFWGLGILR
jgi:hypothetical protein